MPLIRCIPVSLLTIVILASCNQDEKILLTQEEEQLAVTYAELVYQSESLRTAPTPADSLSYTAIIDSILMRAGMTQDEFQERFRSVTSDPERGSLFLEFAQRKLQTLRSQPSPSQ